MQSQLQKARAAAYELNNLDAVMLQKTLNFFNGPGMRHIKPIIVDTHSLL